MRAVIEATEPDVAVFDRFYLEEAQSHAVRSLRPETLRILDMQDCHALRLARQRVIESGGSILESVRGFPTADDSALARELAAVHRSDLAIACSPVEERWLRDVCGVPRHKLALAPLLGDVASHVASHSKGSFDSRKGFVALGTFKHPPNVDQMRYLVSRVWPHIRLALPAAQLTIIGSHPSALEAAAMHDPANGVVFQGHVSDGALQKALREARVLLAPLRFGAGIKGKILDAWAHGTPVVTTRIGSEGLERADHQPARANHEDDSQHWGGMCSSVDAQALAADAVTLHMDAVRWEACSREATALRTSLFVNGGHLDELKATIERRLTDSRERRASDYFGAALWHHRQRSTEYFARWLELKEQLRVTRANQAATR